MIDVANESKSADPIFITLCPNDQLLSCPKLSIIIVRRSWYMNLPLKIIVPYFAINFPLLDRTTRGNFDISKRYNR